MKCPAFGKDCHKCGRLNHFQNRCKQMNVQQVQSSESDNEFEVGTLTTVNSVGNKRRAMITLDVGKMACKPDSKSIVELIAVCYHVVITYELLEMNPWPC